MYWYICFIIIFQFVLLFVRGVGFLPLWTMVEYMQLIAFIPLYNFKLIPYLYDAFKPFLVSHLVLTNETFIFKDMQNDYFNDNYRYYWLNVAKLGQALFLIVLFGVLLIISNIVVAVLYLVSPKKTGCGRYLGNILSQYKYNAYIRFYMLTYFDLVFFSIMKIIDDKNDTPSR